jgi:hypothetical protein
MRLRYYDVAGTQLNESFGGTVCVNDDAHHAYSVDLDPYSDDSIASINIAVMKQTATGEFVATSSTYYANTFPDEVKITEPGVDFGSSGYSFGAPTGSGSLAWGLNDGETTAHLTGTLHLDNSSGVCARMNLRYLTEGGSFWHSEPGGDVCAPDNGHHSWTVDLAPYTTNKITQVEVQLQTLAANGSWVTAGSDTVSIAE